MKKLAIFYMLGFLIIFSTFALYGCAKKVAPPAKVSSKPSQQRIKAHMSQFNALYASVKSYLASGSKSLKPKDFYPLQLENDGYLSKIYGGYKYNAANYNWTSMGGWIGAWPLPNKKTGIGIGIEGSYKNIKPIIQKYKPQAVQIFFPYPHSLKSKENPNLSGKLIMIFPTKVFRH